ncbi:DUF6538 domain-containing protein [Marivita sp. S2033]|uniref:DUF6538 domain-containing protein n=1 Tax=Marivita sp. S2033 TaxID=3373187 RepID=UPI0039819E78
MSTQIRYAYLKGHTWLYRRNYPKEVAVILGTQALKRSLKTGDHNKARVRAAELNAHYEATVSRVRSKTQEVLLGVPDWENRSRDILERLRSILAHSDGDLKPKSYSKPKQEKIPTVAESTRVYLIKRRQQLRPGGFKSVRYSIELFSSRFGDRSLKSLTREDGRAFLEAISQLSPHLGKSPDTRHRSLDWSVEWSKVSDLRITARTQRRIWAQVNHWLDWIVYEGLLDANPFKTVRFEGKIRPNPYEVPSDDEVRGLLARRDKMLHPVLMICLLSGMRAGEAIGLEAEDVVLKGKAGLFFHVRPNQRRLLKTEAAEREVPVHRALEPALAELPKQGPLFPRLTVNDVTKRFAVLREKLGFDRPGLVFHSTRKWFVTQCERTGVPEHFTASLVGHQSARSENGLTYGIYSAGISDEQKRDIVDQIRLPT